MENSNPEIRSSFEERTKLMWKEGKLSFVDRNSIFELIRDVKDPEHPHSLEQLNVVCKEDIEIGQIDDPEILCREGLPIDYIDVTFTPTVPHCSLAGIIGLCLKTVLDKYIENYWIRIFVKKETHTNYIALNKQLNDKDRVMAALENEGLMEVINECTMNNNLN
jgi:metal-sulfur cluster biosynthetic enzyme